MDTQDLQIVQMLRRQIVGHLRVYKLSQIHIQSIFIKFQGLLVRDRCR